MEWSQTAFYVLPALGGLVIGYGFSMRHARRVKRRVVQQMNKQSLELLDARASISKLQEHATTQSQKDNLLKLTLTRLQKANRTIGLLQTKSAAQDKRHFMELSRMRMRAIEAREIAKKAALIARMATQNLRRLEDASQVEHSTEAPEPRPSDALEPATVNVVEKASGAGATDKVAKVSNRDSASVTRLRRSSEATAS